MKPSFLDQIAQDSLQEKGFITALSQPVVEQLQQLKTATLPSVRDMRGYLWISIDPEESQDLDQITFAQDNKLYIAIIDPLIAQHTPIDTFAKQNAVTVYTPTKTFPMFPKELSFHMASFLENRERLAQVIELQIVSNHFELVSIYPALVCNKRKLSYLEASNWLEHALPKYPLGKEVVEQLLYQDLLIQQCQPLSKNGIYKDTQLWPVIVNGIPVALEERSIGRANRLIENCMVQGNLAATKYLQSRNVPFLLHAVREPKRWDRIVALAKSLGHTLPEEPSPEHLRQFLQKEQQKSPVLFADLSLAVLQLLGRGEYIVAAPGKPLPSLFNLTERTHVTAPSRRYSDLVMQRIIKGQLYSVEELEAIALHCTEKEREARKIERKLLKCAVAMVLQKEIGRTYRGMITGASEKGTWVRIASPPIEGKVIHGEKGLDVGDFVKVKLIHVDSTLGFIDFAIISS